MSKRRRLRNTGLCDCGCNKSLSNGKSVWCWNCVTNRKPMYDSFHCTITNIKVITYINVLNFNYTGIMKRCSFCMQIVTIIGENVKFVLSLLRMITVQLLNNVSHCWNNLNVATPLRLLLEILLWTEILTKLQLLL